MTDSDSDVLTYISENSVFRAKGPNIPSIVIMNQNSSNSIMNMPRNFEKQLHNMEPNYLHRNMYHTRETSPMSLCSFRHQPRTFNASNRQQCMSSQRSMIYGRNGSSMSVKSFDSTASVRSIDITKLIKSAVHFNKHDFKSIISVSKLMMNRVHHRYKRYKSNDDSSAHGSDSSTSSGATRFTTTKSMFAGYNNDKNYKQKSSYDSRSVISSVTDVRNTFKRPNSIKRCPDYNNLCGFNQHLDIGPEPVKNIENTFNFNRTTNKKSPPKCLKDRFKNSFLLPSQRFNKTTTSNTIEEEIKPGHDNTFRNPQTTLMNTNHARNNVDSESEEIFSEIRGSQQKRKRNFNVANDVHGGDKKRAKIDTKNTIDVAGILDEKENDFMFAKPQIPVKTRKVKEILVSKSTQPMLDVDRQDFNNTTEHSNIRENDICHVTQHSTHSDVSMKPSFLKRKLYTQTLDVTETKNLSLDNIHSPQPSVYKEINKEKNKTRKLVTGQSCLSRDIAQDDNNLINLIQKIVPSDQINLTLASNKSDLKTIKSKSSGKHSKLGPKNDWDISSLISTCDNDNVSDTFTDEEIFNINNDSITGKKTINVKDQFNNNMKTCKVLVENVPLESLSKTKKMNMKSKFKTQKTDKNDVQENVNKMETRIFNQIKQRDKEEETKDKGVLLNTSLSKQVRCKALPVALSLQNPAKKSKIDDKYHITVSSTSREGSKAKNKLEAISQDKKSVVQRVESFWNTVLESDVEVENDNKQHRDFFTTEKLIEDPKKKISATKPFNIPNLSKNSIIQQKQGCLKENNMTKTKVKSAGNQISVNSKSLKKSKCIESVPSNTVNRSISKKLVTPRKGADKSLIDLATLDGSKGIRTRGKYYLNISNKNSVNSPDFNLHISRNSGPVKKQNLDKTTKNVTNATKTILSRKIKENCKSINNTLDSVDFDLTNTKRKLRPKRIYKQCDDQAAKNIDSMNRSLRSRNIEKKTKISTCNKKVQPNKQMKYTMKKKKMPNNNKSNDLDLTITKTSLRSNDTSFKSR